jgi:hypothetical protein
MTITITITAITMAMTMTEATYRLMTWLSPAYPVGAFSYSHGIEAGGRGRAGDRTCEPVGLDRGLPAPRRGAQRRHHRRALPGAPRMKQRAPTWPKLAAGAATLRANACSNRGDRARRSSW